MIQVHYKKNGGFYYEYHVRTYASWGIIRSGG